MWPQYAFNFPEPHHKYSREEVQQELKSISLSDLQSLPSAALSGKGGKTA